MLTWKKGEEKPVVTSVRICNMKLSHIFCSYRIVSLILLTHILHIPPSPPKKNIFVHFWGIFSEFFRIFQRVLAHISKFSSTTTFSTSKNVGKIKKKQNSTLAFRKKIFRKMRNSTFELRAEIFKQIFWHAFQPCEATPTLYLRILAIPSEKPHIFVFKEN